MISGFVGFCLVLGVGLGVTAFARGGWPSIVQILVSVTVVSVIVGGRFTPARKWIENDWIFVPTCIVLIILLVVALTSQTEASPLGADIMLAALSTLPYPVVARFIF